MFGFSRRYPVRRRGAVVVLVAISLLVIFGFGALAIDLGELYAVKAELQAAADAGALAAASQLAGDGAVSPDVLARQAAQEYVRKHRVDAAPIDIDMNADVEIGGTTLSATTGKYTFQPTASNHDAVRVTVRRTRDSSGGAIPLIFAHIWGETDKDMWAKATAVLIPRDIAVTIDLSGSMNDDSELRHYMRFRGDEGDWRDGVEVNLRDCWCALNGPEPSRPYIPGPEDQTEYASRTGPTIGAMSTWGNPIVPETYSPASDPGLWYIPKSAASTSASAMQASLVSRGYSSDEATCLVSPSRDGSGNYWRNRTAVILGLASWKSGRPGGHAGGNGDDRVDDSEITWTAYPAYRVDWTWASYISYVASNSSSMCATNSAFRYRFGLKTFTNFLLESESSVNQTNNLWQTPEQPLRAVKDAVKTMSDVLASLDGRDQMSLEVFATSAHHEVDLTEDVQAVPNRLYHMQAGHYDSTTSTGAGLLKAIAELSSARARSSARKVIVLMSDGKPNVDENGNYVGNANQTVIDWTYSVAQSAADRGFTINTISVGSDSDQAFMSQLATIGHGQHFHAEGTPDQYSEQLRAIFRTLGGQRPVALIE